jgi:arginine/ornithine N-succinyltransferase beta subunit
MDTGHRSDRQRYRVSGKVVGVSKMAALMGCNVAVLGYRVAELVKLS